MGEIIPLSLSFRCFSLTLFDTSCVHTIHHYRSFDLKRMSFEGRPLRRAEGWDFGAVLRLRVKHARTVYSMMDSQRNTTSMCGIVINLLLIEIELSHAI